jgi:hypothetical protein
MSEKLTVRENGGFPGLRRVSVNFPCQANLFHFSEKWGLESCRRGFQKQRSEARIRAGGKRDERPSGS